MAIPFTKEQEEVIRHKDGSLLVSAAAGSGKTAVLVERVISMMLRKEDPVPLDRILVVTFTNAAARQMKEKIEKRLLELMEEDQENDYLKEQYHLVPLSCIQTNHAFSLRILRDYITRLDYLDPGCRIADETEIKLLRIDVLREVLEDYYSRSLEDPSALENQWFLCFTNAYGGAKQDIRIEDLLLDLYEYMMSDPDPMGWLSSSVEAFSPEGKLPFKEETFRSLTETPSQLAKSYLFDCCQMYEEALFAADAKTRAKIQKVLSNLQNAYENIASMEDPGEALIFLSSYQFERQQYKAVGENEEKLKKTISDLKDLIKDASPVAKRLHDPQYLAKEKEMLYPALKGMQEVILSFIEAYQNRKKEKNIIEFHDFEHGALKIVQDEAVCEALRERFRYIYIDEYQDCNHIQEAIIHRISHLDEQGQDTNVFRVGDVKQSIYRFRQADPSLFIQKYLTYGTLPHTKRLLLNKNFRSQDPILQSVNDVFSSLMIKEVGGLGYGPEERLYFGAKEKESIQTSLTVIENEDISLRTEQEATWMADTILHLTEIGYSFKDIVILLRSVSTVGKIYQDALSKKGIPCYVQTSENFYASLEISAILNLLRVIDNPHQDIPLLGVLTSPIGGLEEDILAKIRLALVEGDFYDALLAFAAQESEDPEHIKVRAFLEDLALWRREQDLFEVHDFIFHLLMETGFLGYVKAMPQGKVRQANVELLLKKSLDFEKGSYSGLNAFLRYIDEMDRDRTVEDEAKLFSEDQDIVRVMTIHQSKGLEFPVVILGGLGREFNKMDLSRTILMHERYGFGPDVIDTDLNRKYPSVAKLLMSETILSEQIAEEIRLLYVAMTRPMDRLIMVGSRKIQEEKEENPNKETEFVLTRDQVLNAKTPLEWLETILENKASVQIEYAKVTAEKTSKETETLVPYIPHPLTFTAGQELSQMQKEELLEKLTWKYPFQAKSQMPQVASVSALKHQQYEDSMEQEAQEIPLLSFAKEEEETPSKDQKPSVSGASRGTAFHAVMAVCSFVGLKEDPSKEVQRLIQEGLLSQAEAVFIPSHWLEQVTQIPLWDVLMEKEREGKRIYREESFILRVPYGKIQEYLPIDGVTKEEMDAPILVQGIIDLFFEDEGEFVLADFKTDSVLDEKRLREYGVQLALYKEALEKASGKKVKKMLILDTRRGREIPC